MKKSLLIKLSFLVVFLTSITSTIFAQDTVRVKHTNYTTVYDKIKNYPVLVEWWVTRNSAGCEHPLERVDKFAPDPQLALFTNLAAFYKNSGLDRGHMCPAADNLCQGQQVEDECFYFSNMAPQYHSLNAGDWKTLETTERQLALANDSVHVWCGNIGEAKRLVKISVPTQCWKVIYVVKTKQWFYYIFDNTADKPVGLKPHETTLDNITKLTGFKFK